MNRTGIKYALILGLIVFWGSVFGQNVSLTKSSGMIFQKALDLYNQENYGAAKALFDKCVRESSPQNLLAEDASFYAAESAVRLNEKDALYRLTHFSNQYPESAWLPVVNFSTANLYFQMGRYDLVMELFDKIQPNELNLDQQAQYFYEKGFCLLKRNKSAEALPLFQTVMNSGSPFAQPASYYYAHVQYDAGNYNEALKGFLAVKDNPQYKKLVPVYLLHIYYQQNQYQKAVDLGKTFFTDNGFNSDPELNRIMANAYFQLNDFKNALPYFETYEKTTRNQISPDEEYRVGYTRFQTGHYQDAISNFQQVTGARNALAQNAWIHLGYCYLRTNQVRFAQNAFVSAYKLNTDPTLTAEALFTYLKLTLKEKGDPYNNPVALAEEFLKSKTASYDEKSMASRLLIQLYLNTNNRQAAISSIEKIQNPDASLRSAYQQLTYQQAVEWYQSGRYPWASMYFEKSLKYPTNTTLTLDALYWKADTYYQMRKYDQAAVAYKTFLTTRNATTSSLYPMAYYGLAYTYFDSQQYSQALEFFKRFLRHRDLNPELAHDANLRLADCYVDMGDYSSAMAMYDKVIASNDWDASYALYQKAYCYGAQGDFHRKVNTLSQLISRYPSSPYYTRALYDMADTYGSALNSTKEAISYFQQLVKEKPHDAYARKALVKMGLLYYKNNQNIRAITVLKQVIALYPATNDARVALSTLQDIYKDMGSLSTYFAYAKTLSFVQVSQSQEDSLTFSVGEDAYLAGNCRKVISSLTDYLQKFPKGGFVLKAYSFLAHCYAGQQDTTSALNYYDKIIAFPQNDYTIHALTRAARMRYIMKDYAKAFIDYKELSSLTDDPSLKLEAIDGSMRSAFFSGNYQAANQFAQQILMTPKIVNDQIIFAHYVLAKTYLSLGNKEQAAYEFKITNKLSKGQFGAEANYNLALMAFQDKNYKEAQKLAFGLSENYPDEVYWVAKGFILLADTYVAQGNVFQARETLKSVIDNYPGKDLKELAKQKLEQLPKEQNSQVNK
ncbi:MAG: tetratricopeptide repeat protein [Bacteroidales bacterium]|nr:tetratricopeptide repeat protein [Bacteroidales bacterium]